MLSAHYTSLSIIFYKIAFADDASDAFSVLFPLRAFTRLTMVFMLFTWRHVMHRTRMTRVELRERERYRENEPLEYAASVYCGRCCWDPQCLVLVVCCVCVPRTPVAVDIIVVLLLIPNAHKFLGVVAIVRWIGCVPYTPIIAFMALTIFFVFGYLAVSIR